MTQKVFRLPPQYNSFLKKLIRRFRKYISEEDIEKFVEEFKERAALELTGKIQSEIDGQTASAFCEILKGAGEDELCILINTILILRAKKPNGGFATIATKLSSEQLKVVRDNPSLQTQPHLLLKEISKTTAGSGEQKNIKIIAVDVKATPPPAKYKKAEP